MARAAEHKSAAIAFRAASGKTAFMKFESAEKESWN
jgi:hypothetical protein